MMKDVCIVPKRTPFFEGRIVFARGSSRVVDYARLADNIAEISVYDISIRALREPMDNEYDSKSDMFVSATDLKSLLDFIGNARERGLCDRVLISKIKDDSKKGFCVVELDYDERGELERFREVKVYVTTPYFAL
jgi:hypothetical protein